MQCRSWSDHCRLPVALVWLVLIAGLLMCRSSQAVVVGNQPGAIPSNITAAPADDPGWNSFSTAGSYVYLGDGWVLSARHVGYNNGMQFLTPTGTVTAHRIPGRYYTDYYGFLHDDGDHYYAISNPDTVQPEAGSPITLSPYTDLQLFRVHAEREIDLPSLKIASEPLPNNFSLNNAPQVLAIAAVRAALPLNQAGRSPARVQISLGRRRPAARLITGVTSTMTIPHGVGEPIGFPIRVIQQVCFPASYPIRQACFSWTPGWVQNHATSSA